MENDNLDYVFDNIINNIDNIDIVDKNIKILVHISRNLNSFKYEKFIDIIANNLGESLFVINFLDKFIEQSLYYKLILQDDLLKKNISIEKIQNLLLLNNLFDDLYFIIFYTKKFTEEELLELYEWIYMIGKTNDMLNSFHKNFKKFGLKVLNYNIILLNTRALITFHKVIDDNELYKNCTMFIIAIMTNYIFAIIDTINIIDVFLPNFNLSEQKKILDIINSDEYIIKYCEFYINSLNKVDKYFDMLIINNCIEYIQKIIKFKNFNILLNPLIEKICSILSDYNNIINIHNRLTIFTKISNLFITTKINYVPINFINNILNFIINVDFYKWVSVDEYLNILIDITNTLLNIDNHNLLFNTNCQNMLFELIKYEEKIFKILESYIEKTIIHSTYTMIKLVLYNIINIINILNMIQYKYINYLNINESFDTYSDIIHKSNLILNNYIICTMTNNNVYKFDIKLLINNIINGKLALFYNQFKINKYLNYGLEFDKIINYINSNNLIIANDFIDILKLLKDELDKNNEIVDTYTDHIEYSIYVDKLFYTEITNPYMFPNCEDFFQKELIRLIIRESNQNPFTGNKLTLEELDNYNNSEHIKSKLNEFINNKKLIIKN